MSIVFLKVIWLLLPAGAANIAAALSAKVFPSLQYPVDCYRFFRGKRIFGDHKTWRGLAAGAVAGWAVFAVQKGLFTSSVFLQEGSLFDYQEAAWFIGVLFSFGSLLGDMGKSFLKRQLNIAPGKPWFIIDQIDWIAGMFVAAVPVMRFPLSVVALSFLTGLLLYLCVKFIGHRVGVGSASV